MEGWIVKSFLWVLRGDISKTLQEWLVLGSQRVSLIRDAIVCPSDANLASFTDPTTDPPAPYATPSAYFYIEVRCHTPFMSSWMSLQHLCCLYLLKASAVLCCQELLEHD